MQTVLETWQFVKSAERVFSTEEREALIDYLASNPTAGVEIVGSGGLRKVRFGRGVHGKSGGARVIYFFYSENAPIYLIACFSKSERENLTKSDVNELAKLAAVIKAHYRKKT